MQKFNVVPLPKANANRTRQSGEDDFGHPVLGLVAKGFGC
jgi:hypothetical protein